MTGKPGANQRGERLPGPCPPARQGGATVLVADGEAGSRARHKAALEQAGYTVIEAGSELEAMKLAGSNAFDLVVLAYHLPDGKGEALCRQLRSAPGGALLPIIHVFETSGQGAGQTAESKGEADAHLTEPVEPEALRETVRSLLRVRGSEAARSWLAAIVENADQPIISKNLHGVITSWNSAAERLFGFAPLDAIGQHISIIIPPDLLEEEQEILARVTRGERVEQLETVRVARDGRRINVLVTISPIRDASGRISGASKIVHDITGRKRMEEALRRSEERYRCFLQASSQIVWTMSAAGEVGEDIPDWNAYTGQSPEQSRGTGWLNAIWPEDRPLVTEAWRKAVALRNGYEVEYRLRREDGLWRNMHARAVPVMESNGEIREWIGTCTDVTERREVETHLKEARNRLGLAQAAGRLGVFDWDLASGRVVWSEELEKLLGLTPGAFEGNYEGWAKRVHPEDRRVLEPQLRQWLGEGRSHFEFDVRMRRADGAFGWFSARAQVFYDAQGTPQRVVGTQADITERKLTEEALERQAALIDLTPTAMFVRTPEGKISLWNKGAEVLYGWSREEAFVRSSHELLRTQFPQPFEDIMRALRQTGHWSGELRHHTRGGRELVVQSWWLGQRDASGEVVEILESNVDVTERKRFQEELEKTVAERTARLQETVGDLEHFSYTITHDMRAPLRAMQAFGEMLDIEYQERLDETGRDYLRRIIDSSRRMDHLITDALSFAKVAREEMNLRPVDAGALIQGIVESYPGFQPPKANVSIERGIPWVLGNEAGLTQCFSNLLGNAVKFVRAGQLPQVRVRGERRGDWVRLWVEDNGIGISAENQKKLFTMFQRLSKEHEGTGIGLALVQKVVERMQGRVGVESEEGKGSRFWVELKFPLEPGPGEAAAPQKPE